MHISLDSALGRQRRLNSVGESLLQISPDASIALSLRSLTGGDPLVVTVRRSSDSLEQDFTASEVSSGALVSFVNENQTHYASDYSSGLDSWSLVTSGWTGSASWSHNAANDNRLAVTATATPSGGKRPAISLTRPSNILTGQQYSLELDYEVISGTPVLLGNNFNGANYSHNETLSGSGTATIAATEFAASTSTAFVYFDGENHTFEISIKEIRFKSTVANGFVETWYDQSGSKNATQTNISNQPKIVESGSLITETRSGVTTAAIKFTSDSGTPANSDFLQTSSIYVSTAASAITTCLVVPCQDDSSEEKGILGKNNSNNRVSIDHNSSNGYRFNMPARREYANSGQIIGDVDLYFNVVAGTTANTDDECFRNNTQLTGNTNTVPSVGADMNQIGSRRGGTSSAKGTDGNYQEIVIYTSDLRSQGADIRNEIINHYSLPQD